jgi:GT2 family glycosyltransferase
MKALCSKDKQLSIIIVQFRVINFLKRCLSSIYSKNPDLNFEVIIVDNGSEEEQMQNLKREFPQIQVLENRHNRGFAWACNQGAQIAQGKYLLFLNPDTEVKDNFSPLLKFMDNHPLVGICGSKMIDSYGRILDSCRSFPSLWTSISSRQSLLNKLFPKNFLSRKYLLKDLDRTKPTFVDWVSGSCLSAKKELWEQMGGFDSSFFMYAEDVDLCFRAKKAGFKVAYFPFVSVVHHLGKSTSQAKLKMIAEHHKSMYCFYKKHYKENVPESFFIFGGIWIRMVGVMAASGFKEIFKKR